MKVVIAGAHGKVAQAATRRLVVSRHQVTGLIRNPDHAPDLESLGAEPVVLDLEHAGLGDVVEALSGADAVVFAAGAGPGSGPERKDSVDRGAAVLLADAAEAAGVPGYLLLSSMGVESVRDGNVPEGMDDVFVAYLQAKLAAEDDILARESLQAVVVRPGSLTDSPGTGTVTLDRHVESGEIPREDVGAVMAELLERLHARTVAPGMVVELVTGSVPISQAVEAFAAGDAQG